MKRLLPKSCPVLVRDPDVVKHNGKFYLCYAAAGKDGPGICVAQADALDGFDLSDRHFVYTAEPGKPWSQELWAPEMHFIGGSWYIYVACDDGRNENHRMYVLANHSDDPMAPYTLQGKITDPTDKWAIDGTVMRHNGRLYFLWSGWEGDENVAQNIYIAEMNGPCEIVSGRVLISRPDQPWEKIGGTGTVEGLPFINEGPFAFSANGNVYIAYSGSGSWCESYCIALLRLAGDDPLNPEHWVKDDQPILCQNGLIKGAGHCSIITGENGELLAFFHAWDKEEQVIRWDTVGTYCGKLVFTDGKASIL